MMTLASTTSGRTRDQGPSRHGALSLRAWIAVCALLGVASACGPTSPREPLQSQGLLLITVDTLRADHLGSYGYSKATSPMLDELSSTSVVFEAAQSPSSWTLPSLGSLLTGQSPLTTQLEDYSSSLAPRALTLAEILSNAGFRTAAVGSHIFFQEKYGLRQGFQQFDEELVERKFKDSHRAITSDLVTDKGLAVLERFAEKDEPWFLWLHYFDPHVDYREHAENERSFGTDDEGRYDGEILFTDRHIGRVLDALGTNGMGSAIVVFTADHGEEFQDHGARYHGHTLYEELLHVPLVVRAPGFEPLRVSERVSLTDVLPTLIDILGIDQREVRSMVEGRSLTGLMRGATEEPRALLSTTRLLRKSHLDSLTLGPWKLVVRNEGEEVELFNLEVDPGEQDDLSTREPARATEMVKQLAGWMSAAREEAVLDESHQSLETSDEELEALRHLGYVDD